MSRRQAKSEMPASRPRSARAPRSGRSVPGGRAGPDALDLLMEDHKTVQQLFKAFEKLKAEENVTDEKGEIVKEACQALTIHAEIEEDIFYPAARDALGEEDEDLLDEAEVEHATARDLIEQIEEMEPGDELYDAKFTVLGEYVNHHIKEEQEGLFPKIRKTDLDLDELGRELSERKHDLLAEIDSDDIEDDDEHDDDLSDEDDEDEDEDEDTGHRR